MKVWQITAPFQIEEVERPDKLEASNEVKVKITKSLISDMEAHAYSGELKVTYPVIPGRFATGIVVETGEDCFGIEKNQRVYISGINACENCTNCKLDNSAFCTNLQIAGENTDGFLKDFAVVKTSSLFALPQSVTDADAMFIERVALAESVLDSLEVQKGDHVAIIGGGIVGNLLCQLLIYKQVVPILIENDDYLLDIAKKCGIYYTLKADKDLIKNVMNITGGRMTQGATYMNTSSLDPSLPFTLCAPYRNIIYAGFYYNNFTVKMEEAFKKHLTIKEVTSGYGHIPTAINLLATKSINVSKFELEMVEQEDIIATIKEIAEHSKKRTIPLVVANMLKPVVS